MRTEDEGKLLRIFVDEGARYEGKLLYEAVVERCLAEGMAGATVVRGIQGYGADMTIHSAGVLRLSADLPVVVEVAESAGLIRLTGMPFSVSVVGRSCSVPLE